jgi:hypothetical protein
MTIEINPVTRRSFFSKRFAMVTAVNILRVGIGLATATSANPVRQHPGFYPNKSYARASGQREHSSGTGETSANAGRRRAARLRMGLIAGEDGEKSQCVSSSPLWRW